MPYYTDPFTKQSGLDVQQQQLVFWKRHLKPEAYALVEQEAKKQNKLLPKDATGYDVWRGTDIETFVLNLDRHMAGLEL